MRFLAVILLVSALVGCKTTSDSSKKKEQQAAIAKNEKKEKPKLREDSDADLSAFVARLRKAVQQHDVNTLAGMMTTDFGYSLKPEKSGEGVFKYWDDENLWPELDGILSEKFVPKKSPGGLVYMVAPPQFADESLNYDGYRAGLRKINGSWEPFNPSQWRAYAPRQRLFRTPNDAFMTGNFHVPKSFIQTAMSMQGYGWVQLLLASVYSGAFHPTAEGQAAIADAVIARARAVLSKYENQAMRSSPRSVDLGLIDEARPREDISSFRRSAP